jgi:histidine ammonia-lyase
MTAVLVLDGASLSLRDVIAVAREGRLFALAPAAREAMTATRSVVERVVASGVPTYGVNTGFGKLSEISIADAEWAALQRNLVRSHAAGVGTPLPDDVVRAMLLLRANVLAKGTSGARPLLVDALAALLDHDILPVVPSQGSVGASGDLAPLAALALPLIGEGRVRWRGSEMRATDALAGAGLSPLTLEAKEGLALINGTQAHTAIAALALHDAAVLLETAHVAGAMSLEGLLGTPVPFDERIQQLRGQPGQIAVAATMRALLAGSAIRDSHVLGDPRVQDAYALRCIPQVHGPVADAVAFSRGIVERELNAATDNPLVFADGTMLSGGNFHGGAVAMASDFLAIALTNLAVISERRIDRLVHPDLNEGLPAFLAVKPGVESGLMMAQVTAAAITSECKLLAHPASVDSIPTDGNKEDVVPMAMGAARKLAWIVERVRHVLAVELLAAAVAIDLRAPLRPGVGVAVAHDRVREIVAPHTGDRALTDDLERLSASIAAGTFTELC